MTVETSRRQIDEVMSGGSYYSQNDMALYFGLGNATVVNRLEIRWPSGQVQEFTSVPANQSLLITEGSSTLRTRGKPDPRAK